MRVPFGRTPVWVCLACHIDEVGHFRGRGGHRDWLCGGAPFNRRRVRELMDRFVEGMLAGGTSRR